MTREERIPTGHPLRGVRELANQVLQEMPGAFDGMHSQVGRPSIPPVRLFRALLLQVFDSVPSQRLLNRDVAQQFLARAKAQAAGPVRLLWQSQGTLSKPAFQPAPTGPFSKIA